jgi:hypothetical protein
MWSIIAISALFWIYITIRNSAFESGYWKGRATGWESHRRMMNTKKKSDEVFDYEKN